MTNTEISMSPGKGREGAEIRLDEGLREEEKGLT